MSLHLIRVRAKAPLPSCLQFDSIAPNPPPASSLLTALIPNICSCYFWHLFFAVCPLLQHRDVESTCSLSPVNAGTASWDSMVSALACKTPSQSCQIDRYCQRFCSDARPTAPGLELGHRGDILSPDSVSAPAGCPAVIGAAGPWTQSLDGSCADICPSVWLLQGKDDALLDRLTAGHGAYLHCPINFIFLYFEDLDLDPSIFAALKTLVAC